jgi:hypothetical protein
MSFEISTTSINSFPWQDPIRCFLPLTSFEITSDYLFLTGSNGRVRLYAGHDVAAGATRTIKKGSMVQFYQLT